MNGLPPLPLNGSTAFDNGFPLPSSLGPDAPLGIPNFMDMVAESTFSPGATAQILDSSQVLQDFGQESMQWQSAYKDMSGPRKRPRMLDDDGPNEKDETT